MMDTMTIQEYREHLEQAKRKKGTASQTKNRAFEFWEQCLKDKGFTFDNALHNDTYTFEYKFHEKRRFRADMAFVHNEICWLQEYEGMVFNANQGTGKSGHTTPKGFTSNTEKYSLAAILGYRVLRYTLYNYRLFAEHLKMILKK